MARKPSRRRRYGFTGGDDVNLTPMMNVFMVIIPFLLMTTVFARTVIIDIYLPSGEASAASKGSEAAPADILTVSMTKEGFAFSGLGKDLPSIAKKNGMFDFELLTQRLSELKARYPDREEEIILFEPSMPYALVIKTMDATREIAESQGGKIIRKKLFPLVSVGEHVEKQQQRAQK